MAPVLAPVLAPVALGLVGGGKSPPAGTALVGGDADGLERSSGAPAPRGVAAVATGGGGALASVLAPSGRGAPGAVGLRSGSNASPRRVADKLASLEGGGADAGTEATALGICVAGGGYVEPGGGYGAVAGGYCCEE